MKLQEFYYIIGQKASNGKSVIFSGVSYPLPGPSPTPSVTPTNAVKGVSITGISEFLTFSNYSKMFFLNS
jgi:hypothetical protein